MSRTALGLLAAVLIAAPASAGRPVSADAWGSFTRSSSGIVEPHTLDTVSIEQRVSVGSLSTEVWVLRRTTETRTGHRVKTRLSWADSRTCPALLPTLATLAKLPPVIIQPPGLPWPQGRDVKGRLPPEQREGSIFDAGDYEISAHGHWVAERWEGETTMRGSAGSPAAAWVESAFAALAPCWMDREPG